MVELEDARGNVLNAFAEKDTVVPIGCGRAGEQVVGRPEAGTSCGSAAATSPSRPGAAPSSRRCRRSGTGSPSTATSSTALERSSGRWRSGRSGPATRPQSSGSSSASREGDRTFFKEDVTDPDVVEVLDPAGAGRSIAVDGDGVVGYVAVVPLRAGRATSARCAWSSTPTVERRGVGRSARPPRGPRGSRPRAHQDGRRGRGRPGAGDRDVPLARLRSRGAAQGSRSRPDRRAARPDDPGAAAEHSYGAMAAAGPAETA